MYKRTDGQLEKKLVNIGMDAWENGWMDRQMYEQMEGWMDECTGGREEERTNKSRE